MRKLDLGAGGRRLPGFTTLDRDKATRPDILADIEEGIPLPDNSQDEVRAHHILEHIWPDRKVFVMSEIWRVLKPGGMADIELPAFPSAQAVMDPTHFSFWCRESFMYFEHGNKFRDSFARRYSECPVPSFQIIESKQSDWLLTIKLKAVK